MKQLSIGLAAAGLLILAWFVYRAASSGDERAPAETTALPADSNPNSATSRAEAPSTAGDAATGNARTPTTSRRSAPALAPAETMGPQDVKPETLTSAPVVVPQESEALTPEEEARRIAARQANYRERGEGSGENPPPGDTNSGPREAPAPPPERQPSPGGSF